MIEIKLSIENIKLVEDFINSNIYNSNTPLLSICDVENAIITFNQIKILPPTSYILFGSNAFGMTSYGFYKAKNSEIYIIEAFCNDIRNYYKPENCNFLTI